MLMEIMQKLSIFDLHVDRFLTIHEKLGIAYEVTMYVKDLTYLQKVVTELEKLSYQKLRGYQDESISSKK